ncbi:class III poly(R)-hydroxyalkanoic acid synthase subunit PhaC [Desulfobotulus sp. H1]|uniref:Poly(3-hydroxyalkanoate) polymerase subunit PhaC n=1 Tax=Desulfobotulus pelophilus TaxID=2823377 RepID=A0ABT3NC10_9BACT|nr:class III poly(R)-hydroxyalkanoic acid synthase subunit PhaC [Desulfobotulus pelophilus]MCW7755003.1 class III poly(R)-hydroxyalkanoic acid synthase subunit PhaC [Desulfobotulus pelophilus]
MDNTIQNYFLQNLSQASRTMGYARESIGVITGRLNTDLAATPFELVHQEGRVRLKHYMPPSGPGLSTPVFIVYALINRETMLDLQPERSVIQNFLSKGIEVYLLEWGYPEAKDQYLTIDDHVNGYMDRMINFICHRHQVSALHLMGVCMGGTFSLIYAALHPEKVKTLITTVTPSRFDHESGLLHVWMKNLDPDAMVQAWGNIPGDVMNLGFLMLNPSRLMMDKYVGFFRNMHRKTFVEDFIRMERWIFDSPDVPGATFHQFIKDCYQENKLIENRMVVGGKTVNLKAVTMPLLNIYGRYDHLVPPEAARNLGESTGSRDTRDICLDTGHIGIYVSGSCQQAFVPAIADWLKKRDRQAKTTKGQTCAAA